MSCVDGTAYQCSGSSIIRVENGVALTASGVQAYGRSTSDLAVPNPNVTTATGLAPASGGLAEIRINKGSGGSVLGAAVLLSNLGLSWDNARERPLIIETFRTTAGRDQLDANGMLTFSALPASSNLGFYDYANRGRAATQANYANNRYFPRSEPTRCATSCPSVETTGFRTQAGDWRAGGMMPDVASATRLHGDGDIHAGDGLPDANGNPTILPGGTGRGVPFPGSKGYREYTNWGLQYGNLGAWITQDTVLINEWVALGNEHNKSRRGFVAYGDVTPPTAVPVSGTASYAGVAYGWYAASASADAVFFNGTATATVNFATRQVSVSIQNTRIYDASGTPVPTGFTANALLGGIGSNLENYLTAQAASGALRGGVSGRWFGPVAGGGSGAGPAEIGGAFTLTASSGGATAIGGFIARKN